MSGRRVPLEQPPFGESHKLQEWLARMMIMVNAAFDQVHDFEPRGTLPEKYKNGDMYYFNQILLPEITHPGPWMYIEGLWQPLAGVVQMSTLPLTPYNGMTVYFTQLILPEITTIGPWMYVEGTWTILT